MHSRHRGSCCSIEKLTALQFFCFSSHTSDSWNWRKSVSVHGDWWWARAAPSRTTTYYFCLSLSRLIVILVSTARGHTGVPRTQWIKFGRGRTVADSPGLDAAAQTKDATTSKWARCWPSMENQSILSYQILYRRRLLHYYKKYYAMRCF